ncbi:Short C-terminal domain-containing protein [Tessaracoccus bendigoensis DSM 12906]|uniref:Short C-terminal domain-containing protein n=1 Tax=Tessaracoccus bendigoensis DSM 12906 TaxID=1123357 RepID=A0A1M6GNU5_9ACTN|nr:SHOCT domain-containing protein [Tessaracoccus bendigoensis]SHJ11665.1 Short C-terminal domain-containing protein [Tessaracoccus bendigoensis DSM 12906]
MSLLRTAARASVATRVVGSTHRRQQQRWAAQDAAAAGRAQAQAAPVQPTPAPAPASVPSTMLDQLAQLGQLRDAGVLTEAEFEAQKQRILAVG